MKLHLRSFIIISLVVLIDQLLKVWIKSNMYLGEEIYIAGNWFIIHFTENNGMAFGMEFGGETGKLILTLFRIVAVSGIGYGLHFLITKKYHVGFVYCTALIFAGALGNIIDSTFYGLFFGYERLFFGRVVDMFYFPIIQGQYPTWFPIWGGQEFIFFRPVFNIADASISVGVIIILLFQKRFFGEPDEVSPVINKKI